MNDPRPANTLVPANRPKETQRTRVRSTAFAILLSLVLVAAGFLFSACGDATTESGPAGEVTDVNAESLADAVVQTWSDCMQQLVALLEDRPEASAVMSDVQALKESTIQSFVALGHQRETLSDSDKAEANALELAALQELADETWYVSYNDLWSHYAADDLEFGNILAAFNILTQYSDFELLKQQLPDEAARLGVE